MVFQEVNNVEVVEMVAIASSTIEETVSIYEKKGIY